jgi:hypothetical protein
MAFLSTIDVAVFKKRQPFYAIQMPCHKEK